MWSYGEINIFDAGKPQYEMNHWKYVPVSKILKEERSQIW
jgi:hypothetical protein